MARDSDPRKRIRSDNILPGVIVLLQLDHSNLQRSVAGFLCEMSADRGTREILYKLNLEEGSTLKEDLLTLLQVVFFFRFLNKILCYFRPSLKLQ